MVWTRLKPNKLLSKYSCIIIIIACIYYPPGVDNSSLREYLITSPDCGIILRGNQFNDSFLRTRHGYEQLVKTATCNNAILYNMLYNIEKHLRVSCQLARAPYSIHCGSPELSARRARSVLFPPVPFKSLPRYATQHNTTTIQRIVKRLSTSTKNI